VLEAEPDGGCWYVATAFATFVEPGEKVQLFQAEVDAVPTAGYRVAIKHARVFVPAEQRFSSIE
jgi:hypothetical protein